MEDVAEAEGGADAEEALEEATVLATTAGRLVTCLLTAPSPEKSVVEATVLATTVARLVTCLLTAQSLKRPELAAEEENALPSRRATAHVETPADFRTRHCA